jgi:DNA-directed RNA polymerase subunit RPC12/RpoP
MKILVALALVLGGVAWWAYRHFQPGKYSCLRCQSRLTYVIPQDGDGIALDCLTCDYRGHLRRRPHAH